MSCLLVFAFFLRFEAFKFTPLRTGSDALWPLQPVHANISFFDVPIPGKLLKSVNCSLEKIPVSGNGTSLLPCYVWFTCLRVCLCRSQQAYPESTEPAHLAYTRVQHYGVSSHSSIYDAPMSIQRQIQSTHGIQGRYFHILHGAGLPILTTVQIQNYE